MVRHMLRFYKRLRVYLRNTIHNNAVSQILIYGSGKQGSIASKGTFSPPLPDWLWGPPTSAIVYFSGNNVAGASSRSLASIYCQG